MYSKVQHFFRLWKAYYEFFVDLVLFDLKVVFVHLQRLHPARVVAVAHITF